MTYELTCYCTDCGKDFTESEIYPTCPNCGQDSTEHSPYYYECIHGYKYSDKDEDLQRFGKDRECPNYCG